MPETIAVPSQQLLERILTLEIVRVTERAAVSAARLRGHGNKIAADQAAVDAMRRELNKMPIDGTIVIGEGERDKAPMLFIGEKSGNSNGPNVDIAVDPLDGTTLCAKGMPGAIATMFNNSGTPAIDFSTTAYAVSTTLGNSERSSRAAMTPGRLSVWCSQSRGQTRRLVRSQPRLPRLRALLLRLNLLRDLTRRF